MKLVISALDTGYVVHDCPPERTYEVRPIGAFSSLDDAFAFIRSRMEPEGEGGAEEQRQRVREDEAKQRIAGDEKLARYEADMRLSGLDKLQAEGQAWDSAGFDNALRVDGVVAVPHGADIKLWIDGFNKGRETCGKPRPGIASTAGDFGSLNSGEWK